MMLTPDEKRVHPRRRRKRKRKRKGATISLPPGSIVTTPQPIQLAQPTAQQVLRLRKTLHLLTHS